MDSADVEDGRAKAWVNFNGTTAAIRKSLNVSSITDTAVGTWVVNFTTNLADNSLSVSGISEYSHTHLTQLSSTVGSVGVNARDNNHALIDASEVLVTVFN